jgi:hypothetical protein
MIWAQHMKSVFGIGIETCPARGSRALFVSLLYNFVIVAGCCSHKRLKITMVLVGH